MDKNTSKLLQSTSSSYSGIPILNSCPLCAHSLEVTEIGGRHRLACPACEFVNWDNPRPVTATVVPMDGGLVLVKRKFPPYVNDWCLPGGFIEALESPEESAIREVEEETGLKVKIDQLLGAYSPGKGINVVILLYLAKSASGNLEAGDDASDVKRFDRAEIPTNVAFELHRDAIYNWFENNR